MDKPKKILIADDNAEIRDIVEILLTSEGFEVIKAEDGQTTASIYIFWM